MYVSDFRVRDPRTHLSTNADGSTKSRETFYRRSEFVHSFRTGKGLRGNPETSYRSSTYKPSGANLAEKLSSRKEYLQGIDRSLSDERAPINYTQGRTNVFQSVRAFNSGTLSVDNFYNGRFNGSSRGPLGIAAQIPASFDAKAIGSSNYFSGFSTGPSLLQMQNYGSRMHHALNPLKASAGIAETVAELLSGNIPALSSKFLKELPKALEKLKKAPKNASQDYLNSQFGLGPILDDMYTILVKGITLHDALYGTSFRRQRRTSLETRSLQLSPNAYIHPPVGAWTRSEGGVIGYSATMYGMSNGGGKSYWITENHDMQFTGRFTLARASDHANGQYDRALALVRQYGLWSPSLLWDLTPWSWLFDWFLNISRASVTAYDFGKDGGLKSDYACVTAVTNVKVSFPSFRVESRSITGYQSPFNHRTTIKHRIPVNPFGNYVELTKLSTWQKSILIALGLARTK